MPSVTIAETPIRDILHTISRAQDVPVKALRAAVERIDEAAPALLAVLDRAAAGKVLDANEESLVFFGLHVLAAARVRTTFAPLLRLLRRPEGEVEDLLGDAQTVTLARIAASVFDGNVDAVFDTIAHRKVDMYVRSALLGAVTYLTWSGEIARDKTVSFLERFFADRLAGKDDYAWCSWLDAVGLLGLDHLAEQAMQNWTAFPENYTTKGRLREMVADAIASPGDATRFNEWHLGLIDDVVQSLAWLQRDTGDQQFDDRPFIEPPPPRPPKLAGRNDPCPCGSGIKYKKCCLGKTIAAPVVEAAPPVAWPAAPPRSRPVRG